MPKQKNSKTKPHCQICGEKQIDKLRPASTVRKELSDLILKETGNWDRKGWICANDLKKYREKYVRLLVKSEKGELNKLEREVVSSLTENDIVSQDVDSDFQTKLTMGQRIADKVADFGGSWTFIIIFGLILFLWMFINSYLLLKHPFDPYPYILLNLALSTLAAIQAPIIMMSQNRSEDRDRRRSIQDYKINLKTELELRLLHQKMDHLLNQQWKRLMEIQEVELDLLDEEEEQSKKDNNSLNPPSR